MRTDQGKAGPKPLAYRTLLERLWRLNPSLPMENARELTGAPKSIVRHVYQRLRSEGVVKPRRIGATS